MTLPNLISLLRIASLPLLVYFLLIPGPDHKVIAAGIFALIALSDAIDGILARKLNAITVFGKYMDPLSDKIAVITALLALVEVGAVSSIPVMILAAREFAVTAFRLAAANKNLVIAADWLGKWKTALQMIAVLLLILSWPYGELVLWLSVLLAMVSGVDYIYRSWEKVFEE